MTDVPVIVPAIRPAEVSDAEQIGLVHVRSWQSAYRGRGVPQDYLDGLDPAERAGRWRRTLQDIDRSRAGILVADSGTEVVGFAGYGPSRDEDADPGQTGQLATIYLLPEVWGTGVGRRLMAATVDGLTGLGYQDATLWVLDSNDRARRFYARAGWAEDGATRFDNSFGFPLHEARYRRALSPAGQRP
jgi:GNAT superfamily N-acetyltransferase